MSHKARIRSRESIAAGSQTIYGRKNLCKSKGIEISALLAEE